MWSLYLNWTWRGSPRGSNGPAPGAVTGPLRARLLAGGRSNLTYEVSNGTCSWVVRRPPLGHVLATAHDMGREYRVITALHGTEVPVPATYALCADAEVTGAPCRGNERDAAGRGWLVA